jgi:large subunit ribosomal protein L25
MPAGRHRESSLQSAAVSGDRLKLEVRPREELGSRQTRRLRAQGLVPGVLYGKGHARAIVVSERDLRAAVTGPSGLHAILDVVVEGKQASHSAILKDHQADKVRGTVIHIDLQEVRLDQPIHATVTVQLHGAEDSPGVREGGALSQIGRDVNVEALPLEVPEHLDLDVSRMEMGDTLRVADLSVPAGVTLLDDPETVIATVTMPTRVEEPEVEEPEEGAEVPEGEEAPEGAAEAPAEPEADAAGDQGTTPG